jgi:hypothetical protein
MRDRQINPLNLPINTTNADYERFIEAINPDFTKFENIQAIVNLSQSINLETTQNFSKPLNQEEAMAPKMREEIPYSEAPKSIMVKPRTKKRFDKQPNSKLEARMDKV